MQESECMKSILERTVVPEKAKQGLPLSSNSPLKLWNEKQPISLLFYMFSSFLLEKQALMNSQSEKLSLLGAMELISINRDSAK